VLYDDRTIKNDGSDKGEWRIEPDGHIYIGRLYPSDAHWFRIVDENTLEIIDPVRDPPTRMKRVKKLPMSSNQPKEMKLSASTLQINSMLVTMLRTSDENPFWKHLLPAWFETMIFSLSFKLNSFEARTILEQCQTILQIASCNPEVS
jgi:hypothetical protein